MRRPRSSSARGARRAARGVFRVDVDETGECDLPDAFKDDFRAMTAALDWARVWSRDRDRFGGLAESSAIARA